MVRVKFTVAILLLATLTLLACPQTSRAVTNYMDGFEGYAVGAYPAPPWWNMFSGVTAGVTNAQAHGGTQSFRIESYPTWARWDFVTLSPVPDFLIYRGAVLVESAGRGGALGFGFIRPGVPNEGRWANAVHFDNAGQVWFSTRTVPSTLLGAWLPGVWYAVEVRIDYGAHTADIYIDGMTAGLNVAADPKVLPAALYGAEVPLDQFGILGDNFAGSVETGVIFLDDVVVGDMVVPVKPATWGAVKSLYR